MILEISISQNFMAVSEALRDSIAVDALVVPLDVALVRYYQEEPFRLKLFYMMARLRAACLRVAT